MEGNQNNSASANEDQAYVEKAKAGNQEAFSKLMDKYKDSIFYMTLKMIHNRDDAEDLTLESFGKAFNKIKKYDNKYAFSTWLFKIATNNCIDFIRKKRLETHSIDEPIKTEKGSINTINVESETLNPEQKVMKEQRVISVRSAVKKLKPKYRHMIELRYYEELSYEEIATELNIPLGTVKAQLFRAKELLAEILEGARERI